LAISCQSPKSSKPCVQFANSLSFVKLKYLLKVWEIDHPWGKRLFDVRRCLCLTLKCSIRIIDSLFDEFHQAYDHKRLMVVLLWKINQKFSHVLLYDDPGLSENVDILLILSCTNEVLRNFVFIFESDCRMQLRGINSPLFINSIQVVIELSTSALILSLDTANICICSFVFIMLGSH